MNVFDAIPVGTRSPEPPTKYYNRVRPARLQQSVQRVEFPMVSDGGVDGANPSSVFLVMEDDC
eukprot:4221594-Amphidinium_carterae.1